MKRRDFAKTIAAAGATLAATPLTARAEGGHGSLLSKKPAFTHGSVEDIPVVLECAINGGTTKAKNPLVPETAQEQTEEIIRCFDAGATTVHSHSNQPTEDPEQAAQFYLEAYRPVLKKHPHAIMYGTANFDPKVYNRIQKVWPGEVQCGHHRILAEAGVTKMVLFDTAVTPMGAYDKDGIPGPDSGFFWYGFWPDATRYILKVCKDTGVGGSLSVFEPCWMKNVVALARTGNLPRGSKINLYFGTYSWRGPATCPAGRRSICISAHTRCPRWRRPSPKRFSCT
jgi:hypothetical protein